MSILLFVDLSSKNKQILKDLMSIGDESWIPNKKHQLKFH